MNLRNLSLAAQNLVEHSALLGVNRDVLKLEDLDFTVLLDESDDSNGIVLDRGSIVRSHQSRPLCRSYVSWPEMV